MSSLSRSLANGIDKEALARYVSAERLEKRINSIAQITATPGDGCSRFTYSKEDRAVRQLLTQWFEELGLLVSVDAVGNIRARLQGSDDTLAPVISGSHIDTVLNGGRFDGVVGVTAAIEAVNCLVESGYRTKRPIEVFIFAEEEGSNFGMTTAGSKTLAGLYGEKELRALRNEQGVSMYDMAGQYGLHPEEYPKYTLRPGDIRAMIEMHVEQSIVLDIAQTPIGIVQAIAGGKWYRVYFDGMANHAGATPMTMRQDPMVAAAQAITRFHSLVREKGLDTTVGTVGHISCEPNASNVIAQSVSFTLDIRDVDPAGVEAITSELKTLFSQVAREYNVRWEMEAIGESQPIQLSERVISVIQGQADKAGMNYRLMNSGAVHDAAVMAHITDVGMIFVPSINGRSHVPDEDTNINDIALGCQLLLSSLVELADE